MSASCPGGVEGDPLQPQVPGPRPQAHRLPCRHLQGNRAGKGDGGGGCGRGLDMRFRQRRGLKVRQGFNHSFVVREFVCDFLQSRER